MQRGWEVELYDGTIMQESKYEWREIPKKEIQRLSLLFDDRRWDLIGKQAYFVRTSASMVPGVQQSFTVEKRCVGFYEGASKVLYVVDEFTGKFEMKFEG